MAINYSLVVTWTYFFCYILTIIITSIVCAIQVRDQKKQSSNVEQTQPVIGSDDTFNNNQHTIEMTDQQTTDDNEERKHPDVSDKQSQETQIRNDTESTQFSACKLVKLWGELFWRKKKVYFQLLPHFFDQATDLGVIFEYRKYSVSREDIGINANYLFWVSIFVIVFHRCISLIAIYRLTKKPLDVLLQLFDLLIVKCIWINYKYQTDEPSDSQKYLQVLEATFEVKLFQ